MHTSNTCRYLFAAAPLVILAACGGQAAETQVPFRPAPATTVYPVTTSATPTTTAAPLISTAPVVVIPTTTRPRATTTSRKPTVTTSPAPRPAPQPVVEKPKPKPASYANCSAVRAAGAAPIRRGDPGFQEKFDADHDGVGCE